VTIDSNPNAGASSVLAALRDGQLEHEILEAALPLRGQDQEALFELARETRDASFPDRQVEARSVIEISNVCQGGCRYCNMGPNWEGPRYTIAPPDFLELAEHIYGEGRRVLLIQSGENRDSSFIELVCRCVKGLKARHDDLVLILCLGSLRREQYARLRDAGAERYVLKFETSNPALYAEIKPFETLESRLACLETLLSVGFAVGTGNIVGLPGQTPADLAGDVLLTRKLPLAMASSSVFIPNEGSDYRDAPAGDLDLTLNTMALMRIANPDILMPTTSSLEKAGRGGQYRGLMAGANTVTIHDGTPERLRGLFPIYSVNRFAPTAEHFAGIVRKAGMNLSPEACHA
jgi:biotin synthase